MQIFSHKTKSNSVLLSPFPTFLYDFSNTKIIYGNFYLKLGYSEKGTKFEKNLPLKIWRYSVVSNFKGKIFFKFCILIRMSKLYRKQKKITKEELRKVHESWGKKLWQINYDKLITFTSRFLDSEWWLFPNFYLIKSITGLL